MAIDVLQTKMKKQSNTLMLDLSISAAAVPPAILDEYAGIEEAIRTYCCSLLKGLKGEICAVRFSLLHYSFMGEQGISILREMMKTAASLNYYTVLDIPGLISFEQASDAAEKIWGENSLFPCDAVLVSGYPGSDVLRPFLPFCEEKKKDLFVLVKSVNRSSSEIQDLLAGSRTVHMTAVDNVNRYGANTVGKYGYTRVGVCASAAAGDSLKMIRAKYPRLFIIADGMDQSGANAKNCSLAFDSMGHGAIVCIGSSVTGAWKYSEMEYVDAALEEVHKVQKRISRYVTVL